ncbi:substrate-binding periplasmic protein (plasmid) [Pseudoalteromonas sp. T1lg65]|uniref:substrate-binding periplasmic protein n=1 Tax=Pseudoalteromonas sp. T1lg65 TaxID=2077101 RepID=UPI003F7A92BF
MLRIIVLLVGISLSRFADADTIYKIVTELSPPNQTVENHKVAGTSTELVKQITHHAGIDTEFTIYPWARAYKLAMRESNTLIYSMARTPERENYFHWIGPVALFHLGFVTNSYRDDVTITTLEHAKQYKLALQRGDVAEGVLKALGFDYVLTTDIEKSYELLIGNKVDLVLDDPRYLSSMAKELNLPQDHFKFVFDVKQLSVKGYLAANYNTSIDVINKLKLAFTEISQTDFYHQVLESAPH